MNLNRNVLTISQVFQIVRDYKSNYIKNGDNSALHTRSANRILQVAEQNGGIYIKLGQHLSSLVFLVPDEYITVLSRLQDNCPTSSMESLNEMVEQDTGYSITTLFKDIDITPIGTASLAQVHRCGDLAIKFQHPTLYKTAQKDMQLVTRMTSLVRYVFPDFNLLWLSEETNRNLPKEMDFRQEAVNAEQLRNNFFGYSYYIHHQPSFNQFNRIKGQQLTSFGSVGKVLKIPKIHFATKRILCMEYSNGAKINDIEYMKKHNIKPHQVSRSLSYLFGNMIFLHGFVHCDPHLGNILIEARPYRSILHSCYNFITGTPNFHLVLLDHGLYRELTPEFRVDYAYLWKSLLNGNEDEIKYWSTKLGNGIQSHRLFSSILTGRSWETISTSSMNKERSKREQEAISRASVYIKDIADILATVPRELLLVLKTNDLLRNAEHVLNCGPYISYFTLFRLVNCSIYTKEHNIFYYLQQDLKWRFLDYSLGFYYTCRSFIQH